MPILSYSRDFLFNFFTVQYVAHFYIIVYKFESWDLNLICKSWKSLHNEPRFQGDLIGVVFNWNSSKSSSMSFRLTYTYANSYVISWLLFEVDSVIRSIMYQLVLHLEICGKYTMAHTVMVYQYT